MSGRNLCALNEGCVINIPFETLGSCKFEFDIVCASPIAIKGSEAYEVSLDNKKLEDNDTSLTLKPSDASQYWNWNKYNAGSAELTKGQHILTIRLLNGATNIDSFQFMASNYSK